MKVNKFKFDRDFAFRVIKRNKLADLDRAEEVNELIKSLDKAGPVPKKFLVEDALRAITAKPVCVKGAFVFAYTPHGHDYWMAQSNAKVLSADAKAILVYWASLEAGIDAVAEELGQS